MPKRKRKKKVRVRRSRPSKKAGKRRARRATALKKRGSKPRRQARSRSRSGRKAKTRHVKVVKKPKKVIDPRVAQVMKVYAEGMKHFNRQNFRRARSLFEKVVGGFSRELAERARVHLAICEQRLQRPAPVRLRTADDHYHYAVAQINAGNYDQARVHLQKAVKLTPKADYVQYALASVAALTGEAEEALDRLERAIKLSPENRYHARNDADFKLLEDDARFLALVYPDRPAGSNLGTLHA